VFNIGDFEIQVEKAGGRRETYEDFKASLPFTDCRFAVYDQEYKTADGRPASKIWFISWFPQNSTPYNKMAYTTAKTHFRDAIPGVFDAMASR
jgi:cofilin